MTLSFEGAQRLLAAGFIEYEVDEFSAAISPTGQPQPPIDLDSPVWQRAIESRQNWTADKINRGWTLDEIENSLMSYYADVEGRSPWDFLKVEYRPPEKLDYKAAIRRRAGRETAELRRI